MPRKIYFCWESAPRGPVPVLHYDYSPDEKKVTPGAPRVVAGPYLLNEEDTAHVELTESISSSLMAKYPPPNPE